MVRKTTTTRNPDRTRRRLLQAAIKLFANLGYHAVSVDQIVASARVNKRMVYHYFGSKEHIYEAALLEVYGRIELVEFTVLDGEGTPREKLHRLLKAYFQFLDQNPEFVRMLLWENLEKSRHSAVSLHRLSKNPFLERFRKVVEQGVREGQFRADLDVTHLVIHLIGLCFIYHSNRFSLSQSLSIDLFDPKVKARGLEHVIALVFGGIDRS